MLAVAQALGFVELERDSASAAYMADCEGMYQTSYVCERWVMRKPL